MINSYKDLIVWQKAMELVDLIYNSVRLFPKNEDHCLSFQIKKSVISIPSNIAEGYGRKYTAEYKRFLEIARGSLYEMQTQVEIGFRQKYMTKDMMSQIDKVSLEIEKMLNTLIKKIDNK